MSSKRWSFWLRCSRRRFQLSNSSRPSGSSLRRRNLRRRRKRLPSWRRMSARSEIVPRRFMMSFRKTYFYESQPVVQIKIDFCAISFRPPTHTMSAFLAPFNDFVSSRSLFQTWWKTLWTMWKNFTGWCTVKLMETRMRSECELELGWKVWKYSLTLAGRLAFKNGVEIVFNLRAMIINDSGE